MKDGCMTVATGKIARKARLEATEPRAESLLNLIAERIARAAVKTMPKAAHPIKVL